MILSCGLQCFLYEQMLDCSQGVLLALALLWPVLIRVQVTIIGYHSEDMLYAVPFQLLGDFVLSVVLTRYNQLWQIIVVRSLSTLLYSCAPILGAEIKRRYYSLLCSRLKSSCLYRLLEPMVRMEEPSTRYDRHLEMLLCFTVSVCSCVFRPFMLLVFYFLQSEANMPSKVFP